MVTGYAVVRAYLELHGMPDWHRRRADIGGINDAWTNEQDYVERAQDALQTIKDPDHRRAAASILDGLIWHHEHLDLRIGDVHPQNIGISPGGGLVIFDLGVCAPPRWALDAVLAGNLNQVPSIAGLRP